MSANTPRRKETVTEEERHKADFLTEYASLCASYGYMVCMVPIPETGYRVFAVMEYQDTDPGALDRSVQEMLVGNLWEAAPRPAEQEGGDANT